MGIATILKLLPNDKDGRPSKAFYLQDFLGEYAPSIGIEIESHQDLPKELSQMIIAPLPTCHILQEDSLYKKRNQEQTRNKSNKNTSNRDDTNKLKLSRCQQSVQSIVDDVVYSLVQKREKLRCQRNHKRKNSFKRRRKLSTPESNNLDHYCGANTLVHGFGVSREGDAASLPGMKAGITYHYPNENVTFCKSSPIIKKLHEILGDEVFRMILLHTRCFLPILGSSDAKDPEATNSDDSSNTTVDGENDNYILLCGPPLSLDSSRLRTAVGLSHAPTCTNGQRKRRRRFPSSLVEASPLRANEALSRFSLMYSDSYVPRVALPKSHPFPQRLERQKKNKQQKSYEFDDFNFMLNVIFDCHLDNKNKQRRMKRRLKGAGKTICELLWKRYSAYNDYGRVLSRHCPISSIYNQVVSATPLNASNTDEQLAKLAHVYTPKDQIVSFLSSVLENVFPNDFWGSHANFRSFLASVRSFVHLRKQEKLANKNLMHGISITSMKWLYPECEKSKPKRNRNKQRTNHEAATELTLQAFRWVFKGFVIPLLRSSFYVTETEFDARELHYYRRPIWALFRALALQKITSETTANVEQDSAKHTNIPHFRTLPQSRALQSLRKQKMGISKLRFLPKATGMRPIAQLSRSAHISLMARETIQATDPIASTKRARIENHSPHPNKKQKVGYSSSTNKMESLPLPQKPSQCVFSRLPTNIMLEKVLDVLTYECSTKKLPYGNGLGNLQEFYVRYRKYLQGLKESKTTNPPKLFFGKIDIEKCYDRIHQNYLFHLVQDMVLHNSYVIQTIKLNCANQKSLTTSETGEANAAPNALRFKKIVETIEEYESFYRCTHPMAQRQQRTIFETLKCSLVDKPTILQLLREHLLQHFVVVMGRHKPKILLQTRGISQGSTLSMLLCNLYYGRVEALMQLCDIGQDQENLLSRFVDDFLFVSPNETSFREFLDTTHRGRPDLGANINPSKTLVNVEASVNNSSKSGFAQKINLSCCDRRMNNDRNVFPWCGLLFDTTTGAVMVDYSRFRDGKIRKSLTIDAYGNEGEQLSQRLRAFLFPRCLPILYDDLINSFETIVSNFYQMMLFGACKAREYLQGLNSLMKRQKYHVHNDLFLMKCICGLSGYAIKNIRSKARHCLLNNTDKNIHIDAEQNRAFSIHPSIASFLSLQAFYDVFSYSRGFDGMTQLLRESVIASSKGMSQKLRRELRKIMARALENFRLNTMIDK